MTTIHKFAIKPGKNIKSMPQGAEILTVQTQNDEPFIWAMVNTKNEMEARVFEMFGTGHEMPVDMGIDRKYIGTFQIAKEGLVFHLFERL